MASSRIWLLRRYADGIPADDVSPYANDVIKAGVIASMFWGIAGMLVGVVIALQLAFPTSSISRICRSRISDACGRCTRRP